jgi:lambda repressor-like predicted transcriptional regulator
MKDEIKKALKTKRYKLYHLADQMGYTKAHLYNVLNKKHKAPKQFIFTLCACLNEMTGSTFTTEDFKEYTK